MFDNIINVARNLLEEFNNAVETVEVVVLQEPLDIRISVNDVYTNEEVEIVVLM